MHLFHCPALTENEAALPEDEAHHARSVLRLPEGTRIGLLDGRGTMAEAEITAIDKRHVLARIIARRTVPAERTARIHLAVAPTKRIERFEWMLEKCTEIGVDRITPLMTGRTERARLRQDRLARVLISAIKQSQRAWLPVLDDATTLDALLRQDLPPQRFFGWCEGERVPFAKRYDPAADALVLIGPEGDLTADESRQLMAQGFAPVSLGPARLRTETAAITACAVMNAAQEP